MNSINTRLVKILSNIRSSNAENSVIQQVVDAINTLNFGQVSSAGLAIYYTSLDTADQMEYIKLGGNQYVSNGGVPGKDVKELSGTDLYRNQQAAFSLEFIRQRDLEPEEIDGQMMAAFQIGMLELFGRDWEHQIQKPRGSQSVACGYSKEQRQVRQVKVNPDTGESVEKMVSRKVKTDQTWIQVGSPILSLKPFENGKHPTGFIQREIAGKLVELEVPVHQPTESGLECGVMLTDKYWTLATKTTKSNRTNEDITAGMEREVFIVGLVSHWKMRKCNCVGCISVGSEVVDLAEYNSLLGQVIEFCDEEDNDVLLQEALMADPLVQYYRENFIGLDPVKLAHNARAGVSRDRLTKDGKAPKIWMGRIKDDLYKDAAQRASQTRRYLDYQVDDVIRRLLGDKKLTSAERLADAGEDVTDWYDEVYNPETGRTFYQQAILELHKRWKSQNRNYMKEIGTVTRDGNELHVVPKNIGKCGRSKDVKRRTGDKSTTVNGARCRTLTTAFMHVEVTLDKEIPGWETLGFRQSGKQFVLKEVMEARRFAELMTCCEMDTVELALEEMESGDFKFGGKIPTKDDISRLYNGILLKMSNASTEFMISRGNAWICFRDHLTPEWCLVEMRHIEVDELKALQAARERVMACGEELTEQNILSALRHPGKWTQKASGKIGSVVSAERLAEVKAMLRAAAG